MKINKAVFLDRDGVINEERGYVHRIADFKLIPGVPEALIRLRNLGYKLVVVTNQGGIARGLYGRETVERLHLHMENLLSSLGVQLDRVYYCPHHPAGSVLGLSVLCNCRKPMPGMLLKAAEDLSLDLRSSVIIGDKMSDISAGIAAGVGLRILVESGHPIDNEIRKAADASFADLKEAALFVSKNYC